jgi:hypothetical protein
MAVTRSAWTEKRVKGRLVANCTVAVGATETDASTLKTPKGLDGSKPWTVIISYLATPDGQATPVDIWGGYGESFAVTGTGALTVVEGVFLKNIIDDSVLAVVGTPLTYAIVIDPTLPVADAVAVSGIASGLKVRVPPMAYYAFNVNGGSALVNTTHYYTIVQ